MKHHSKHTIKCWFQKIVTHMHKIRTLIIFLHIWHSGVNKIRHFEALLPFKPLNNYCLFALSQDTNRIYTLYAFLPAWPTSQNFQYLLLSFIIFFLAHSNTHLGERRYSKQANATAKVRKEVALASRHVRLLTIIHVFSIFIITTQQVVHSQVHIKVLEWRHGTQC